MVVVEPEVFIHASAQVDRGARIGPGTRVWVNAQIREGARVGSDCVISKDVYIDRGVLVGNRCKIQNGVSLYNGVTLGDEVFVGPEAVFTNDKVPRAFSQKWEVVPTVIGDGASLGANCTIICGVSVGEYAMIAAGSVVTRDVPAYTLVQGNPARPVSQIDRDGLKVETADIKDRD